ncbi:MAG: hypothetical protein Q9219_005518 [cf. Caloplaca sp. 3 TL-2023]
MGVTGLWSIVQPCARPIKIETLNRKRLAVDASIWIYQFLKAVRDKEGNALRNSHVVGFFRRICKLLFFGIKPVFVFDGGAPALKRQTISGRKQRREGRREDAVRTAGRLLAVQMQRRAEEEDRRRRDEMSRARQDEDEEEVVPENMVYVDEIQMTAQERQQNRQFKKKDAYHLPSLDVSLAEMGAPNDPRIMSHEELEEYAKQFHTGEDVNFYDFSKIDFNGPFFQSLPATDRYNILNAARLRSRLRMGYSKEQLDTMFPDRMAFSKFQVERVRERNELTQRLMNINGMNGEEMFNGGGRVAGEKGKEYVLVKNDGVEGGWALGVVSNKNEGQRNKPIDVEGYDKPPEQEEEEASEEEGFEDVPIEGLNRLPKRARATNTPDYNEDYDPDAIAKRRRALYEKRLESAMGKEPKKQQEQGEDVAEQGTESLFLPEEITEQDLEIDEEGDALFEDVPAPAEDSDEELNRAIAMSLEQPDSVRDTGKVQQDSYSGPRIDMPLEFNQKNAKVGRNFAHQTNARAHKSAPNPFGDSSDEEDDFNLQAALEESRQSKRKPTTGPRVHGFKRPDGPTSPVSTAQDSGLRDPTTSTETPPTAPHHGFGGPLPFESLNLGKMILKKKKKEPIPEEEAGGFERESEEPELPQVGKKKPPQPLPPWFTGDIRKDEAAEAARGENERRYDVDDAPEVTRIEQERGPLVRQATGEVIDLDAPPKSSGEVIKVDSSGEENENDARTGDTGPVEEEVRMGDVADFARAKPPNSSMPLNDPNNSEPSGHDPVSQDIQEPEASGTVDDAKEPDSEEPIEWEESDLEDNRQKTTVQELPEIPAGGKAQPAETKSPSPTFEDVEAPASPQKPSASPNIEEATRIPSLPQEQSIDILPAEDDNDAAYSDPEDEDLMRQLAIEAEEHARFASTLNAKSQAQNAEEYEKELRQLRNQQKKDRRDADEVTHVMVTECQQLLKLFGLPYITAPMEAEAQCAELVSLGLVDGIVTDDSDIFLFGGTRVYKNMFNQAKFVECYLSSDLEKEYSLDRQKLIGVAHLLGSDYTDGIPSVGPVTALEILSEFDGLEAFAEWCNSVQLAQSLPADATAFHRKFRKQAQKLFLPTPFPDKRVDAAYLHPEVDSENSPFEWGVPDLDSLRAFLMATIGWTKERTDEVLVPVIRDMNRREVEGTQANITRFFEGGVGVGARQQNSVGGRSGGEGFAPRRRGAGEGKSGRMEKALGRLRERQARKETTTDSGEQQQQRQQEPNGTLHQTEARGDGTAVSSSSGANGMEKATSRSSRKRTAAAVARDGEGSDDDDDVHAEEVDDALTAPPKKVRLRGKKKAARRGKRKG